MILEYVISLAIKAFMVYVTELNFKICYFKHNSRVKNDFKIGTMPDYERFIEFWPGTIPQLCHDLLFNQGIDLSMFAKSKP